jgi:uncharacterized membrane protein YeaQ/YmgE (transglycosylase-associated protein family)
MDLLSLSIVGAISSVLAQYIKRFGSTDRQRALIAIIVSLVVGSLAYWINLIPSAKEAVLGTIVLANVFYNALIKHLFASSRNEQ